MSDASKPLPIRDEMMLWADADALPKIAKELLIKTAERTRTRLILVANQSVAHKKSPWVQMTVVAAGFDKADAHIVEQVQAGDLVVTSDIPLAHEVLAKGAKVITARGHQYTPDNIAHARGMRDFMDNLRGTGVLEVQDMGGQKPYSDKDKKAFADGLNRLVR